MKKLIVYFGTILGIFTLQQSCASQKVFIDKLPQKDFQIIDTITIENAIGASIFKGKDFINIYLDSTELNSIKHNDINKIVNMSSVYLAGTNTYAYNSPNLIIEGCSGLRGEKISKDVILFRHNRKTQKFLLAQVNVSYFNYAENHENFLKIDEKRVEKSYVIIVFPICN